MQKAFQYGTKHYLSQSSLVSFIINHPDTPVVSAFPIILGTYKSSYCILPSATLLQTASEHHDLSGCFPHPTRLATIEAMTIRFLPNLTLGRPGDSILLGMKKRLVWLQNSAFQSDKAEKTSCTHCPTHLPCNSTITVHFYIWC